MIWSVDTDRLRQVAGSKDEKLRRMIGGRFKRDIARLDEMFDGSGGPNTYEALRQIVDGTIPEGASGGVYAYAFKLLVEHFGRFLDNGAVYPWNRPDFSEVNAAFEAMGVPFRFDRFYGFELPAKLPYPDDFPLAGYVDPEETKAIAAAFARAETKAAGEAADIVEATRGWFLAAAKDGRGLVSYYH